MTQSYTATLVAATLAISRSSLYYRKRPRGSRADRTYDEQIVMACGEKLAYGYRRVAWWLQRKKGLPVNRKRVLADAEQSEERCPQPDQLEALLGENQQPRVLGRRSR